MPAWPRRGRFDARRSWSQWSIATTITSSGYPAWLAWLFLHLVFLVGFKNRMVVLVQWLVAYVTRQRGVRLITGGRM